MRKLKGVKSGFVNGFIHVTVPLVMVVTLSIIYPPMVWWLDAIIGTLVWWFLMFRIYLWFVRRYVGFQDDPDRRPPL